MNLKKQNYHPRGISLKLIGFLMSFFAIIVSGTLIASLWLISDENQVVTRANENYITLKQASSDIQAASDDLTNYVRLFVANEDEQYLNEYFKEAKITKRRENALETIHTLSKDTSKHEEIHSNIALAVDESMDLMKIEYYAMKLICVDAGISCKKYPEIEDINIDSVAPENRKSEALNAVLGPTYIAKKDSISYHIYSAVVVIDGLMHENGTIAADNLQKLIVFQTAVIVVIIVYVAVVISILFIGVVRPMNVAINSLKNGEQIKIQGSSEFNYLADTYNDVCMQNEKVKERLVYEAEHDKLTSLYNRSGYVSLYRQMNLNKTIYILLDADGFKRINDEYGHEMGDKVLVRVAETLEKNFKEDNAYVFRLGGDEFSVLIENVDADVIDDVINRCKEINKELSTPKGRIPALTMSIGIAHGEDDDTTDTLFKKADIALYKVKHNGKSDIEVYK